MRYMARDVRVLSVLCTNLVFMTQPVENDYPWRSITQFRLRADSVRHCPVTKTVLCFPLSFNPLLL